MLLDDIYLVTPKNTAQKPFIEVVQELCQRTEPKPLFCELPEDLNTRSVSGSETTQTYTYTNSMVTISAPGTSTTTT